MSLRGLATLLLLGGIVYALLSGNWGIGAIAFGLGAVMLGLDQLRVARGVLRGVGFRGGLGEVRGQGDGGPAHIAKFLEAERRTLPSRIFRQEYMCSFEENEDAVFGEAEVWRAFTDEILPLEIPGGLSDR
jgi:hypothetical protein